MDATPATPTNSRPDVNPEPLTAELLSTTGLKAGVRTTEFWLTLLLVLILNGEAISGLLPAKWAAIATLVAGIAYKALRTWLKIRQAGLEPVAVELLGSSTPSKAEDFAKRIRNGTLIPLIIAALLFLPGCANMQPATREKWKATGQYVGKRALRLATSIVLEAAVSAADRDRKTDFAQGLATAFRSRQGELITSGDVRELVQIWTPPAQHWTALGAELARTYAAANPQTPQQAAVVLEGIAQGLEAVR